MPANQAKPLDHAVPNASVMQCSQLPRRELETIVQRYGLEIVWVGSDDTICGSYWGDTEAGLIGASLYVRDDTPVHSALHELCHYVCMSPDRRGLLDTNAGGDYDEENGVCYLQILLADHVSLCNRKRMQQDMDLWGYTFRLGSAKNWFEHDAGDARDWLYGHGLIDKLLAPTWQLRGDSVA